MGRPAILPAMSQRATSTAPMALVETDRLSFHMLAQMAPMSSGLRPSSKGLMNSISGPTKASAPCLEEPKKALPDTPSSVLTVITPSSLWPPNVPVAVPQEAVFQLNRVTLNSVIFMIAPHPLAGPNVRDSAVL